jgi:hypothetical protein
MDLIHDSPLMRGFMKNGFAASQKSFPLRGRPVVIMIYDKPLTL